MFCTIEKQARMEKEDSLYTHCSSSAAGGGDTLNGLNFGKKIYFEGVGSVFRPTIEDGPPKSPAKKGRGAVPHGGQPRRCQVEGCNVDLSDAKAYYSRHKVCGMHSKSPKVIVAGFEQRFCQQCSRFHQLSEFDQGKRSCRRRLAGHNERRRKAQPGPPMLSPPQFGLFAPSSYDNRNKTGGGFLMSFGGYSNLHARESFGPQHHHQSTSSMMKYEIPFQNSASSSSFNPMIATNLGISSSSSDECYNTRASDSSGALSLLSNQSWTGGSRTAASSTIGIMNDFIGNNSSAMMNNVGEHHHGGDDQFGNSAWDFKGSEMRPDLGLAQMSHHHCNNNDDGSRYNGEVGSLAHSQRGNEGQFHELGVSSSGGYDDDSSSVQHINWLL